MAKGQPLPVVWQLGWVLGRGFFFKRKFYPSEAADGLDNTCLAMPAVVLTRKRPHMGINMRDRDQGILTRVGRQTVGQAEKLRRRSNVNRFNIYLPGASNKRGGTTPLRCLSHYQVAQTPLSLDSYFTLSPGARG